MSSQELTRQQYSDIKGIPSAAGGCVPVPCYLILPGETRIRKAHFFSCLLIINPSYASYTFNPPL
jgi:hypothetical protein